MAWLSLANARPSSVETVLDSSYAQRAMQHMFNKEKKKQRAIEILATYAKNSLSVLANLVHFVSNDHSHYILRRVGKGVQLTEPRRQRFE
jgi:hypothetical protein